MIGVVAVVVGVIYLVVPSHSLPSFFPGHVLATKSHPGLGKHNKKGDAGVAAGVVLVIIAIALVASGRRSRHRAY